MRLKEIDTMESAEKLKMRDIYVKRDEIPPLPEGRYYISDIIGLSVKSDSGEELGEVSDVFSTGSNDVYSVKKDGKELLIPVIDEVVKKIDLDNKEIIITPIKGLINDED